MWNRKARRATALILSMLKTNAVTQRSDLRAVGSQLGRRSNSVASPTSQQERRKSAKESPNERGGYPRRFYWD
jgi:hypothetical protein